ncbi:MAG TPA: EAL domain-containing protein [Acidimicrobiales bacterium]|jgi:diguanylate cyclase (GGDEF)-like protein/PAS domain S-box-containing protein|nr:EAL domain-containing protein [Acidimicrobiales bacterium]
MATNGSSRFFETLVHSSADIALVADPDGTIRYANAAVALFGYTPDDLVGRNLRDFVHPDDQVSGATNVRAALGAGGSALVEWRIKDRDGMWVPVEESLTDLSDNGDVGGLLISIRDIADRRVAEQALVDTQTRLVVALEASRMAVWEIDFSTQEMVVSPNFHEVYGFTPDRLTGTYLDFLHLVHPDDLELLRRTVRVTGQDDVFALDYRICSPEHGVRMLHGRGRRIRDESGQLSRLHGAVIDVTDERRAERRRLEAEQTFRRTIEATSDGFIGVDAAGLIVNWNASAARIFGWTEAEAVGQRIDDLIVPPELRSAHRSGFSKAVADGQTSLFHAGAVELTGLRADGSRFPVEVSVVIVEQEGGLRFNAFVRDVTERKATEALLARQAITDELTNLPNRALLNDRFQRAKERADSGGRLTLLFVDIDHLNVVNDSLGHDLGDQLIREVADRILGVVPATDTVTRFGGDEFVVLTDSLVAARGASGLAEAILQAIARPYDLAGHRMTPAVTIGVAMAEASDARLDELLRDADIAMYRAKAQGRNRFEFFEITMREQAQQRFELANELRQALDGNGLRLYYQPVVSADGTIVSTEALVRWEHPDRGLIHPGDFIPLAEETGLILPLGQWVLETACRQAVAWRRDLAPTLGMAVNMSVRQLSQPDLVGRMESLLGASGLEPGALCLELTESALMEDPVKSAETLGRLRTLGLSLAIDDFGTGYSSLHYLSRLSVQVLKLDRVFIESLDTEANRAIVGSTIQLARALGMTTVAEGVETAEQRAVLIELGCESLQGFLWSKPVPADAFEQLLRHPGDWSR